ncbi:MAG TPA: hypothetical protein PL137_11710 [Nocardioides sp.]|nr:hypothetical protein [Nocardioides sp.]
MRAALREFTHSLNTPDSVNVIAAWPRHAEAPATFPNAPNGTEAVV